ncbi:MAG: bifunctional phosphopantothenoylcysteine decarboxylase/phosphopantothenate--cysteine ligase CoaBC [Flavobacteriales bacterium]|nr:bifunctional phosphopantothenoylcysteine decarboxylase/phosphopantothenate--cysteine ligase CoaBC [Flavobacteriales bacterium]
MSVLQDKNVLIAVTGGIAAYKITYLVRLLVKNKANVKVIMTPASREFVSPFVLSTLSKNPVESEFIADDETWNNHVELALWSDLMIVAPATANTIAKMANAQSDNLVLATYLSQKSQVYVAPAMDLDMYKHSSNQENIEKLKEIGNKIIPVGVGELASGLEGEGRMAEPENIVDFIENDIQKQLSLNGKNILITAGPTYESIDPVRFIGNHSSGKMGYSLAKEALKRGANVILISGPTHLDLQHKNLKLIRVQSAYEMYTEVMKYYAGVDIVIKSAAVSDYKPKVYHENKIKKEEVELSLELEKNIDILSELGKAKENQFLVGFALETNNELENAKSKLKRKNLDMIVLNSLQDKDAGFKKDTNKIYIISKDTTVDYYETKSKELVAVDILDSIEAKLNNE